MFLVTEKALHASINPERTVTPLFHIPFDLPQYNEILTLEAPIFEGHLKKKEVIKRRERGGEVKLSYKELKFYHQISKSVFRLFLTDSGPMGQPFDKYNASAFHIGKSIIATNYHNLYPENANSAGCSHLEMEVSFYSEDKRENRNTRSKCDEILFCDKFEDICFVKMSSVKIDGLSYEIEDISPALEFFDEFGIDSHQKIASDEIYYSVNNTDGFGLQGSSGKGAAYHADPRGFKRKCSKIKKEKKRRKCIDERNAKTTWFLMFYAPLLKGASGSPVLNSNGKVIGITRAQSPNNYGPEVYSKAVTTSRIIGILEKAQKNSLLELITP